jgi:hypothetical protein
MHEQASLSAAFGRGVQRGDVFAEAVDLVSNQILDPGCVESNL